MLIKVALLLLHLGLLARAGCSQTKEVGCWGCWPGIRVMSPLSLAPSHLPRVKTAGQISDGTRLVENMIMSLFHCWWHHHPAPELLGQGLCLGNISPPGGTNRRQALPPEAGQEKVGASWKKYQIIQCFEQQIFISGLAPGCLFAVGAVGQWGHGGCSLPWPRSQSSHFRHSHHHCSIQTKEPGLWQDHLVSLYFLKAGCITGIGNIFPDSLTWWDFLN